MKKELKVKNIFGEKLDVLIEGNENADEVIIFVHGFGTDKDEGFNLHQEIAENLKNNFLIVRFDQSGYGKSEGQTEDSNILKHSGDLKFILNFTTKKYSQKKNQYHCSLVGNFCNIFIITE